MTRTIVASLLPLLLALSVDPAPAAESGDPATVAPPVNLAPGTEYADGVRMFQGIPGLERSPGGRLWATWYGGGVTEDRHNYVMLVTSGDNGRTWSSLKLVLDPDRDGPVRAFDPCLWLDPTGRLWLFWAQRAGKPFLWAMTTENPDDETPAWSEPRMISEGIMMNKPTVAADGAWLLPAALWSTDDSCRVIASADQGRTWKRIGAAGVPDPKHRNCDEPMLVQRKDGSLWMLIRTRYGIGESFSSDGGKTWTDAVKSPIEHATARFFIRRLASGSLLLVKHGPLDRRTGRSHLTAYLSSDDGKTFGSGLLLDERAGVSYPDGFQAPDGTIHVVYDYHRTSDKQILMAAFTEADVRAGNPASEKARLRVLINQATGTAPPKPRP